MAEQQMQPRQIAYKVRIGELLRGEYIEQDGWQPNFVKVGNKQVSRVNIIATIIDTQPGANFGSITVDDGSGALQVRAFNEDSAKLSLVNIGDVVIIIGRPRRYGNQMFISYEIVKKLDPLWLRVRQKELGDNPINGTQTINVQIVKPGNINENKKRILGLIQNIDNGNGADIDEVVNNSGFTKKEAEDILEDLIKVGEIYENIAGKVKLL